MGKREVATTKNAPGSGRRARNEISAKTETENGGERGKGLWLYLLALVAAMLIVYSPALNGKPVWDDDAHMTKPELRSLHGLVEIWMRPEVTQQYYPVTHTVFWLEQKIAGDSTLLYHLVNVFLHLTSALILYRILRMLGIPMAWFAAALFALHPVQVESVAWISELKNALSGVFFLLAALVYLQFDQSRRRLLYFVALGLFVLGLGSKTSIAPLPAALLVVFWWKRGKLPFKRDVVPLIPFFAIGIAAGFFTAWIERAYIGAEGSEFNLTTVERCLIAGRAFWFYLGKLFWPTNLVFIYPRWQVSPAAWWQYIFPIAALALAIALWIWRKRQRGPLAAFLFFVGMLFPALGFFNVYPFVFSFVADHFQYLASIGIFALVAASTSGILSRYPHYRRVVIIVCLAVLVSLGMLTYGQAKLYVNAETLYRATLQKNPECWMAHDNLGVTLVAQNRLDEGIDQYRQAIALRPDNPRSHYDLGIALRRQGRNDEAVAEYEKALELRPEYEKAHNNLGNIFLQTGRVDEAITQYEQALGLRPNYAEAHNNLGNAFIQKGSLDEAIAQYQEALRIRPDYGEAYSNLGNSLVRKHKLDGAIEYYLKALNTGFNPPQVYISLGDAMLQQGRAKDAIVQYQTAASLASARDNVELADLIDKKMARARELLDSQRDGKE